MHYGVPSEKTLDVQTSPARSRNWGCKYNIEIISVISGYYVRKMPYPDDSSHMSHWLFSEEKINEQRIRVFHSAETLLHKKIEALGNISLSTVKFPTQDAISDLISYFVTQLIYVCSEKRFDYRITTTAAVFFIRFYLRRSPLEYDPRRVLLTCILLAAKVEESSTSCALSHFCEGLIPSRERLKDIVDCELALLDALSFQIRILHARPPIHFLTTEYYQTYKPPKNDEQFSRFAAKITELNTDVEQLALQALSDPSIPFLYSPAHLAIACFLHCCSRDPQLANGESLVKSLISKKKGLLGFDFTDLRPVLLDLRTRLAVMLEQSEQESVEERAQRALKTLKQIEKITKLLNKTSIRNAKKTQQHADASQSACRAAAPQPAGTSPHSNTVLENPTTQFVTLTINAKTVDDKASEIVLASHTEFDSGYQAPPPPKKLRQLTQDNDVTPA